MLPGTIFYGVFMGHIFTTALLSLFIVTAAFAEQGAGQGQGQKQSQTGKKGQKGANSGCMGEFQQNCPGMSGDAKFNCLEQKMGSFSPGCQGMVKQKLAYRSQKQANKGTGDKQNMAGKNQEVKPEIKIKQKSDTELSSADAAE
jgi:hypothetical protein